MYFKIYAGSNHFPSWTRSLNLQLSLPDQMFENIPNKWLLNSAKQICLSYVSFQFLTFPFLNLFFMLPLFWSPQDYVVQLSLSMHDFCFLTPIICFVSPFILESFSRSHPFDTMSSLLDSMSKHYIEVGTWSKQKTKSTKINPFSGFILTSLFTFLLISIRVNPK